MNMIMILIIIILLLFMFKFMQHFKLIKLINFKTII